MRPLLATVLVAALAIPGTALADDVVLPPLVPKSGTENKDVANVTALISSELDWLGEVDRVAIIAQAPAALNLACLDKAACLSGIDKGESGSHVFAGSLRMTSSAVTLDLVYYNVQTGRFVRRKSFELENRPEVIADSMGPIVRAMVTGEVPED
mgnify:CR=1 FL=1